MIFFLSVIVKGERKCWMSESDIYTIPPSWKFNCHIVNGYFSHEFMRNLQLENHVFIVYINIQHMPAETRRYTPVVKYIKPFCSHQGLTTSHVGVKVTPPPFTRASPFAPPPSNTCGYCHGGVMFTSRANGLCRSDLGKSFFRHCWNLICEL